MIPTVIVAGMAVGLAAGMRRPVILILGGLVVALTWGALVAAEGALVAGSALAVPNYLVGLAPGLSLRYGAGSTALPSRGRITRA